MAPQSTTRCTKQCSKNLHTSKQKAQLSLGKADLTTYIWSPASDFE